MINKNKDKIKLISFQSADAIKSLFEKGYLECDESKINLQKYGHIYNWIVEHMNKLVKNEHKTKYPLWCWVKCYNAICPPKKKGQAVKGFDFKITFSKLKQDVFITDFIRYSFLLNNQFIPSNLKEKNEFIDLLKKNNITENDLKLFAKKDENCRNDKAFLDICTKIQNSFEKCITQNSKILQGCVWRINLEDIDKIEIIKDDGCIYGSLNYVRSNGKRINWIKEFYKTLK